MTEISKLKFSQNCGYDLISYDIPTIALRIKFGFTHHRATMPHIQKQLAKTILHR